MIAVASQVSGRMGIAGNALLGRWCVPGWRKVEPPGPLVSDAYRNNQHPARALLNKSIYLISRSCRSGLYFTSSVRRLLELEKSASTRSISQREFGMFPPADGHSSR